MSNISQLLDKIRATTDCVVKPSQGLPQIGPGHRLPDDLIEFYILCGGISLFGSSAYSVEIVPPNNVLLANPVIFIGVDADLLRASQNDISWSWYIIGEGNNRQYLTIDLAINRLGRSYDSFWDSHAMPGYSPIIAQSFTELLLKLHTNQGRHWYWFQPDFHSVGDAYD